MSRSGYNDEGDNWDMIRWRGAVHSAIRGKRGQAFLRELLAAMDALPVKELIAGELEEHGQVCALGAVGKARGYDMHAEGWDLDGNTMAMVFGIPSSLAAEIMFINDDDFGYNTQTPAWRFYQVKCWAERQLVEWEDEK